MRWSLLVLYVLLSLAGCEWRQGLVVQVKGLTTEVVSLDVQLLQGGRARPLTIERSLERFGVEAPEGLRGPVEIAVSALSQDHCVVAQGRTTFQLRGDLLDEALIELRALDAEACHTAAQHRTDGVIVSQVSTGRGRVTSDLPGIACGAACSAIFARGAQVTLSAQPDPDSYFVRWLGACKGVAPTCQLSIAGMAQVKAVFGRKACATAKVCWESPLPQGNALTAVWGSSRNDVWAVGMRGTILHFDGYTWSSVASPTTNDVLGVWGSAPDDVWMVTTGATLRWDGRVVSEYKNSPGGNGVWGSGPNDVWFARGSDAYRWNGSAMTIISPTEPVGLLRGVWGFGPRDVWMVGSSGTVVRWDGEVLAPLVSGLTGDIDAIWGLASDNLWLNGGGDWGSTWWNGNRFEPATTPCQVVWGFQPDTLWSSCHQRWTGTAWERMAPDGSRAAWGSAPDDVWFVGKEGRLLHWDGATVESAWAQITDQTLLSVTGSATGEVWAATATSVLRWDSAAFKQVTRSDPGTATLNAVYASPTGDLWVLGSGGLVERWDGAALRPILSGTSEALYAAWSLSDRDVWAVGDKGTVLRWDGSAFSKVNSGSTANLRSVWGSGPDDVWTVGSKSIIRWSGAAFAELATGSNATMTHVFGSGPNDVWLFDTTTKPWRWTGAALERVDLGLSDISRVVWMSGPNDIWVVNGTGASLRSILRRWDGKTLTTIFSGANRGVATIGASPPRTPLYGLWSSGPGQDVWAVGTAGTILRYRP